MSWIFDLKLPMMAMAVSTKAGNGVYLICDEFMFVLAFCFREDVPAVFILDSGDKI
jgi:hypothetical protein